MFSSKLSTMARAILLASTVAATAFSATPASAAAPMAKFSAPGFFRVMLGSFEVTALSDGTADLPMDKLLHQPAATTNAELARAYLGSPMETSVNAYLINTGDKLVLIDTGAGALLGPTLGKLLANLRAAGYDAAQVDEVLLTHLHPDHVGGLAPDGKSVFPNAVVRGDQRDADYWLSTAKMAQAPADAQGFFQGAMTSLKPYIAAHQYRPFTGSTQLEPGISAIPGYGHTPGHTVYVVESQGQKLLVGGDLIHVPAVQLEHPEVSIAFDTDGKEAVQARASFFAQAAKSGELVAASHMPFPGLGHVRISGKTFEWIPVNYTQLR